MLSASALDEYAPGPGTSSGGRVRRPVLCMEVMLVTLVRYDSPSMVVVVVVGTIELFESPSCPFSSSSYCLLLWCTGSTNRTLLECGKIALSALSRSSRGGVAAAGLESTALDGAVTAEKRLCLPKL